ncbi:MAG: methionyl-tRNA formyltransferase [Salinivirgaceae bacterium]|nr:MAG: methionyl-tRNA formyltransferase [Salinivirgaceae bacterium]
MSKLRIIFMGTPDFAVKSLEALHKEFNIVAVITAPDKKRGRGQMVIPTPVKQYAYQQGIPIIQQTNLKDESFIKELSSYNPDINAVVAFRMLPKEVWNLPKYGSINLHASLLPDYRGAAPINHAIINGEKQTGVTTFFLREKIDTGNIIMQQKINIYPDDTAGTLHDKLMVSGAELLVKTMKQIETGDLQSRPQTTVCKKEAPKIFKEDCKIDWSKRGTDINNFVRGLSPYPAAWASFKRNNKPFTAKIFAGKFHRETPTKPIGTVVAENGNFGVVLPKGLYEITEIQPQSKKRITGEEFLRGLQKGDVITLDD